MIPVIKYRLHGNSSVLMPYYDINRPMTVEETEELDELFSRVNGCSVLKDLSKRTALYIFFQVHRDEEGEIDDNTEMIKEVDDFWEQITDMPKHIWILLIVVFFLKYFS